MRKLVTRVLLLACVIVGVLFVDHTFQKMYRNGGGTWSFQKWIEAGYEKPVGYAYSNERPDVPYTRNEYGYCKTYIQR